MKKYIFNPSVLLFAILLFGFSSCTKDNDDNSIDNVIGSEANASIQNRRLLLTSGSWDVIKTAHDNNMNGIADPDEIVAADPTEQQTYTYDKSGSGTVLYKSHSGPELILNFNWELLNNDQQIQTIFETGRPILARIVTLTKNDFVTETGDSRGKDWVFMKHNVVYQ